MQDQCVRKIPVGVPCSRLGDEDDPYTSRKTLYLMRFETETARTARDEVCGFEGGYPGWVREAGWKLDRESRNQEADDLVQVISSRNDSSRNAPLPRADVLTEKDFIPQDCYLITSVITVLS
jgi:hypothetical protein